MPTFTTNALKSRGDSVLPRSGGWLARLAIRSVAALLVAPIMQMNPWTDDGRPVDGVRIKLRVQSGLAPAKP